MDSKNSASLNVPIVGGGSGKREHFFNQIILQLPEAFYTCDATGIITFLQPGCCRPLGMPTGDRERSLVRILEAILPGWAASSR